MRLALCGVFGGDGGPHFNCRPFEMGGIPAISQAVPWPSGGGDAAARRRPDSLDTICCPSVLLIFFSATVRALTSLPPPAAVGDGDEAARIIPRTGRARLRPRPPSRSLTARKIGFLCLSRRGWAHCSLEVTFQQHVGGNCIRRCSKCHFIIACSAKCVAISSGDEGAFPKSLSVNSQGTRRGLTGSQGGLGDSRVSSARGNLPPKTTDGG